jgi:superfamily II DNA/RNA helicase
VEGFSNFVGATSSAVYGGGEGATFDQQRAGLIQGVDIVVATSDRLLSHINLKYVDFSTVKHLVLDEADRMLDMGFYDDLMKIVRELPIERQTLLFSATMPPKIRILAEKILHNPESINIAISKPAENIIQAAYMAYENQKIPLIRQLLKGKTDYQSIIIFTSRKINVKNLVRELKHLGFKADGINSDLEQKEREEVLLKFRNREIQILVATDIVARGIDIEGIDMVMNFDVPRDPEDYVHRIGRTARAQSSGVAITLISELDQHNFKRIEDLIEREVIKIPLPPELGEAPSYDPEIRRNKRSRFAPKNKKPQSGNFSKKKIFVHRDRGTHQGHQEQG